MVVDPSSVPLCTTDFNPSVPIFANPAKKPIGPRAMPALCMKGLMSNLSSELLFLFRVLDEVIVPSSEDDSCSEDFTGVKGVSDLAWISVTSETVFSICFTSSVGVSSSAEPNK